VTTLVVFLICSLNTALANEVSGEARVRDADTIVVSGTPVRLNGIETISLVLGCQMETRSGQTLCSETLGSHNLTNEL
jgi:endonuclease YncB( thermonuclease family)